MEDNQKETTIGTLNASQLAMILNADKSILRSIGTICFRRCIPSYEKEYLNDAEMVCVDRCTYKYDQMLKHVVENNPALRVWMIRHHEGCVERWEGVFTLS